jgi:3-oxoacyl-[acyl-carrier-protein] synthase II
MSATSTRPGHDPAIPRIVVTGLGLLTSLTPRWRARQATPLREQTWRALAAGESALRRLVPEGPGQRPLLGAPLHPEYPVEREYLDQVLFTVGDEAVEDAGLKDWPVDRERVAVYLGWSKGAVRRQAQAHALLMEPGYDLDELARLWPGCWPGSGASQLARRYGLRGPSEAPVAACATGLVAVLRAAQLLRRGDADIALAGSVDASIEPLVMGAFQKMKAFARPTLDPTEAVRPCDRNRSGFLPGEGGAVLVLETAEHARRRGAIPYVELAGGALGADAYHETSLSSDPRPLGRLISRALMSARVEPEEIDHVNLHATATLVNDPLECQAVHLALGGQAARVACTASKPQIGHLLGAAGAAELALTILALRDDFVPPTLNLHDPDPLCDLDVTPLVGQHRLLRGALKLSLGFGGHLAAAVLRKPDGPVRESRPILRAP